MAASMKTDIGLIRKQNEDSVWMDENKLAFAVADGMGGHLAGEVASSIAVQTVKEMVEQYDRPTEVLLEEIVTKANERIRRHASEHKGCMGMGTTLSMMWQNGEHMYIAHVGDSRIYRMRNGKLEQITEDHSLVYEMVRSGLLTAEEARVHPHRNIITRALGASSEDTPDLIVVRSMPGDVWLLCSDGLCGYVEDHRIEELLKIGDPCKATEALINAALEAGGGDNVSVIVYRDEEAR